jgi:hypothetical protein
MEICGIYDVHEDPCSMIGRRETANLQFGTRRAREREERSLRKDWAIDRESAVN